MTPNPPHPSPALRRATARAPVRSCSARAMRWAGRSPWSWPPPPASATAPSTCARCCRGRARTRSCACTTRRRRRCFRRRLRRGSWACSWRAARRPTSFCSSRSPTPPRGDTFRQALRSSSYFFLLFLSLISFSYFFLLFLPLISSSYFFPLARSWLPQPFASSISLTVRSWLGLRPISAGPHPPGVATHPGARGRLAQVLLLLDRLARRAAGLPPGGAGARRAGGGGQRRALCARAALTAAAARAGGGAHAGSLGLRGRRGALGRAAARAQRRKRRWWRAAAAAEGHVLERPLLPGGAHAPEGLSAARVRPS